MEQQEPTTLQDVIIHAVGDDYNSERFKSVFTMLYMGLAQISKSDIWYNLNLSHADETGKYAMTESDKVGLKEIDWRTVAEEDKRRVVGCLELYVNRHLG